MTYVVRSCDRSSDSRCILVTDSSADQEVLSTISSTCFQPTDNDEHVQGPTGIGRHSCADAVR